MRTAGVCVGNVENRDKWRPSTRVVNPKYVIVRKEKEKKKKKEWKHSFDMNLVLIVKSGMIYDFEVFLYIFYNIRN